MKISLIHYSAPPIVGGVESVMARHACLFYRAGHQVNILAGRGEVFDAVIGFKEMSLLDSRNPEVMARKAELDQGKHEPAFDELVERITDELNKTLAGTDIVIAHNVASLHKNLALTAALHRVTQQTGAPRLIIWHHDLAWSAAQYKEELHPGYPWDLLRKDWPWATHVAVSDMRRRELSELMGIPTSRIHVVANGIDPIDFHKLEPLTASFYRRLALSSASPLILLPTRITRRKNIELALRVLSVLRSPYPRARLLITGPLGPHNPANLTYFNQLIDLRHLLGLEYSAHFLAELTEDYIPDQVISDFYHLADVLLYPSREEGFGLPILEAGLAGIPVFCAGIEPLMQLGADFATYFSPDAEPAAIAAQLTTRLARSPMFALRTRVLNNFTWDQIYAQQIAPLL